MKKILVITGTRPEIIKMSPILHEAQRDPEIELIHADSSQHYDYEMNRQFFQDLKLPPPDYVLSLKRNNEISQISSLFGQLAQIISTVNPDIVLSQGDTNTTMITALVANRLGFPFGHVEAGLRSFDLSMPEEINRKIAATCAAIHFCPTHLSGLNLLFEGIDPNRIFITGNTIVDAVKNIQNIINKKKMKVNLAVSSGLSKVILVTLHRPNNVDNPRNLEILLHSFESLPEYQFIFPVHPRTLKNLKKFSLFNKFEKISNLSIIDPLGYIDFISLLLSVDLVVTDSGGVQEECFCLNRKCLTLRTNTERPETLTSGLNRLVDMNGKEIQKEIVEMISSKKYNEIQQLLGKGDSSKKIIDIVKSLAKNDLNFLSPTMLKWEDYKYKLDVITETLNVKKYQKRHNRKIMIVFNDLGEPHIPKEDFKLCEKFKVVTSRSDD